MAHHQIKLFQDRAQQALEKRMPAENLHPARLHQSMRYSVLNGGKRVRPVLAYATGEALGVSLDWLDGPAVAVELIHAYSLIHDDLPAMDDDDLRRGRPTCHKAFDEATAILAGDALQAMAFQVLSCDTTMGQNPEQRLKLIQTLSRACGSRGMAGGQAIDLESTGKTLNLAELEDMHIHKTGALLRASVLMGALSKPNADAEIVERLDRYGKCIGLAFQIRDDILDITADTETLGKPQGSDVAADKATYPALLGLDGSRQHAAQLHEDALEALEPLGAKADKLRAIAAYIVDRAY